MSRRRDISENFQPPVRVLPSELLKRTGPGTRQIFCEKFFKIEVLQTASLVSASEMASFLGKNEMEISRLGARGVLVRSPDPDDKRKFLYDLAGSVRGYIAFLTAPAEKAKTRFLLEKGRNARLQRELMSLDLAVRASRVVPREPLMKLLTEHLTSYRRVLESMPARVAAEVAENEEERAGLQTVLEHEVNEALRVLMKLLTEEILGG
jgi:hypothetical protein